MTPLPTLSTITKSPCRCVFFIMPVFFPLFNFVGVSVNIWITAPCKLVHPRFSNNTTDFWFHMWEWFRCAPVCRRSHPQQRRKILLVTSTGSRPQHPGFLHLYQAGKVSYIRKKSSIIKCINIRNKSGLLHCWRKDCKSFGWHVP